MHARSFLSLALHAGCPGLAALALAVPSTAQSQAYLVDQSGGPGVDFQSLTVAADTVPDGSTLYVRTGDYNSMSITGKSLTVVEEPGAEVTLRDLRISGQQPSDVVVVIGITVEPDNGPDEASIRNSAGTVWLEDMRFIGRHTFGSFPNTIVGTPGLEVVACANLVLIGGRFEGGFGFEGSPGLPGIDLDQTSAALWGVEAFGGGGGDSQGGVSAGSGGDGVLATDSFVFASDVDARGGSGGYGYATPFCNFGGSGGDGVHADSTSTFETRDSVLQGGIPGGADCAPGGSPGQPGDAGAVQYPTPSASLSASAVVTDGDPVDFQLTAQPSQLTALVIGTLPGFAHAPFLEGTSVLGNIALTRFLITDGSGVASKTFNTGGVVANFTAVSLFAQGIAFDPVSLDPSVTAPASVTIFGLP